MLSAVSRLGPLAARFTRQIVPPVIATLIAAGLIAAYNRAFSGNLQSPRMAAMHGGVGAAEDDAPATIVSIDKPAVAPKPTAYETAKLSAPARLSDKEARQDAGKDQTSVRIAAEPIPALVRAAQALHREPKTESKPEPAEAKAAPRAEPKEPKAEPSRIAAVEPAQPIVRAPVTAATPAIVSVPPSVVSPPAAAPTVAAMPSVQDQRQPIYRAPAPQPRYAQPAYQQPQYQPGLQPPPVITAQPMVTAPDKERPVMEAQAETATPPQGVFGKVVDTLKPSNLLARAREFGEKIEAAGNDILPSIRQQ
jgi:hypothetical protein